MQITDILATRFVLSGYNQTLNQMRQMGGAFAHIGDQASRAGMSASIMGGLFTEVMSGAGMAAAGFAVKYGSAMMESENLSGRIFGEMAKDIEQWSKKLEKASSLNQFEIRRQSAIFMQLATSLKLPRDEAFKMSKVLTQLGIDLSSFYDVPIEKAMANIQSGLIGNTRAMYGYGISLDAATLKSYAYSHGIAQAGTELNKTQKVMAAYGEMLAQTEAAHGDFGKSFPTSAANQARQAFAMMRKELAVTGVAMQHLIFGAFSGFRTWLPVINQVLTALNKLPSSIKAVSAALMFAAPFLSRSIGAQYAGDIASGKFAGGYGKYLMQNKTVHGTLKKAAVGVAATWALGRYQQGQREQQDTELGTKSAEWQNPETMFTNAAQDEIERRRKIARPFAGTTSRHIRRYMPGPPDSAEQAKYTEDPSEMFNSDLSLTPGYPNADLLTSQDNLLNRRAKGGGTKKGETYIVGEKGPEIFVPSTNGTIIPNHQIGKMKGLLEGTSTFGGFRAEGDWDADKYTSLMDGPIVKNPPVSDAYKKIKDIDQGKASDIVRLFGARYVAAMRGHDLGEEAKVGNLQGVGTASGVDFSAMNRRLAGAHVRDTGIDINGKPAKLNDGVVRGLLQHLYSDNGVKGNLASKPVAQMLGLGHGLRSGQPLAFNESHYLDLASKLSKNLGITAADLNEDKANPDAIMGKYKARFEMTKQQVKDSGKTALMSAYAYMLKSEGPNGKKFNTSNIEGALLMNAEGQMSGEDGDPVVSPKGGKGAYIFDPEAKTVSGTIGKRKMSSTYTTNLKSEVHKNSLMALASSMMEDKFDFTSSNRGVKPWSLHHLNPMAAHGNEASSFNPENLLIGEDSMQGKVSSRPLVNAKSGKPVNEHTLKHKAEIQNIVSDFLDSDFYQESLGAKGNVEGKNAQAHALLSFLASKGKNVTIRQDTAAELGSLPGLMSLLERANTPAASALHTTAAQAHLGLGQATAQIRASRKPGNGVLFTEDNDVSHGFGSGLGSKAWGGIKTVGQIAMGDFISPAINAGKAAIAKRNTGKEPLLEDIFSGKAGPTKLDEHALRAIALKEDGYEKLLPAKLKHDMWEAGEAVRNMTVKMTEASDAIQDLRKVYDERVAELEGVRKSSTYPSQGRDVKEDPVVVRKTQEVSRAYRAMTMGFNQYSDAKNAIREAEFKRDRLKAEANVAGPTSSSPIQASRLAALRGAGADLNRPLESIYKSLLPGQAQKSHGGGYYITTTESGDSFGIPPSSKVPGAQGPAKPSSPPAKPPISLWNNPELAQAFAGKIGGGVLTPGGQFTIGGVMQGGPNRLNDLLTDSLTMENLSKRERRQVERARRLKGLRLAGESSSDQVDRVARELGLPEKLSLNRANSLPVGADWALGSTRPLGGLSTPVKGDWNYGLSSLRARQSDIRVTGFGSGLPGSTEFGGERFNSATEADGLGSLVIGDRHNVNPGSARLNPLGKAGRNYHMHTHPGKTHFSPGDLDLMGQILHANPSAVGGVKYNNGSAHFLSGTAAFAEMNPVERKEAIEALKNQQLKTREAEIARMLDEQTKARKGTFPTKKGAAAELDYRTVKSTQTTMGILLGDLEDSNPNLTEADKAERAKIRKAFTLTSGQFDQKGRLRVQASDAQKAQMVAAGLNPNNAKDFYTHTSIYNGTLRNSFDLATGYTQQTIDTQSRQYQSQGMAPKWAGRLAGFQEHYMNRGATVGFAAQMGTSAYLRRAGYDEGEVALGGMGANALATGGIGVLSQKGGKLADNKFFGALEKLNSPLIKGEYAPKLAKPSLVAAAKEAYLAEKSVAYGATQGPLSRQGAWLKSGATINTAEEALGTFGKAGKLLTTKIANGSIMGGTFNFAKAASAPMAIIGTALSAHGGYSHMTDLQKAAGMDSTYDKSLAVGAGAVKGVGSTAGMLVGASQGALVGAALGSVVPILGNAVGGVAGGIIGGVIGAGVGDALSEKLLGHVHKTYEAQIEANNINKATGQEQTALMVKSLRQSSFTDNPWANMVGMRNAPNYKLANKLESQSSLVSAQYGARQSLFNQGFAQGYDQEWVTGPGFNSFMRPKTAVIPTGHSPLTDGAGNFVGPAGAIKPFTPDEHIEKFFNISKFNRFRPASPWLKLVSQEENTRIEGLGLTGNAEDEYLKNAAYEEKGVSWYDRQAAKDPSGNAAKYWADYAAQGKGMDQFSNMPSAYAKQLRDAREASRKRKHTEGYEAGKAAREAADTQNNQQLYNYISDNGREVLSDNNFRKTIIDRFGIKALDTLQGTSDSEFNNVAQRMLPGALSGNAYLQQLNASAGDTKGGVGLGVSPTTGQRIITSSATVRPNNYDIHLAATITEKNSAERANIAAGG